MASREEEVAIRRIIACFAAGSGGSPESIARLAKDTRAELLGLFVEDTELLRFAALPFAAEVAFHAATPRRLDVESVERAFRSQAAALRRALAASLDPVAHAWSFRVARGTLPGAVEAALAEGFAPALLLPPGARPLAERRIVRLAGLDLAALRALLATSRPVLVLPGE